MAEWKLATPVAFLIFNRPGTTARVLTEIAKFKPAKLLVVADGPRSDHLEDPEKCQSTRAIIERLVDWDCEVLTNYSDINLGCKKRVSSGLDWVFANVEEAIILEDDCLPHPTFFRFCQEMLERYRDDTRIMQICGFNALYEKQSLPYSYYFSKFGPIWGWASWRRAWQYYDVDMKLWPLVKKEKAYCYFCDGRREISWRLDIFEKVYRGEIDTWDYQWAFAKHMHSGLSLIPHGNLIVNIGFGADSTHTANPDNPLASVKYAAMELPLKHPPYICRNKPLDRQYLQHLVFAQTGFLKRFKRFIKY